MKEFFTNIKNIIALITLVSLIATSAIAIESRYVLSAEFQQFRAQDQYRWIELKLERLNQQILDILNELKSRPGDKLLNDMLNEAKKKREKLLKIRDELEQEYGLKELAK